ncbi:O-antigen ligase [Kordia periserrulae]|uniref:O-antigen ligase n=1 Tax=Kordia periserrulae TaxID=701523 RepID=A0A2T6C6X4_9FLAO|nr:O-antigen ligase family protein [Kordia periserrulae]PTX64047.1 O-antigen ligase [Kordia periserrulae]
MPKNKSTKKSVSSFNQLPNQLIIAHIFLLLYMISCFVPLLNAMDYDAPQWLYFSLLNIASLIFLFKNNSFFQAFQLSKKAKLFFGVMTGFFVVGCVSMLVAINVSESLVHLSRLLNMVVATFCVFTYVRKNPKVFFYFAGKVSIFLVAFYGWRAISYFVGNATVARTNEFLLGFQSGFSSINIYTAFLVIQIPLLIFGFLYFSKVWKYASGISLFIGIFALLLSGSRTASLSLVLILISVLGFLLYGLIRQKKTFQPKLEFLSILLIPIALGFLVLNINRVDKTMMNSPSVILNTKPSDYYKGKKAVTRNSSAQEKLPTNTIKIQKPASLSSGRFSLWELAFRNFKKSPVLGIGYGNYKAVGKKEHYQNFANSRGTFANPRRAHSDFIEKLAETGIIGFVLYVSLFVLPLFWFVRLLVKEKEYRIQFLYFTIFLVAAAYTLDALLNFPLERPPIQLYFMLSASLIIAFAEKKVGNPTTESPKKPSLILFGVVFLFSIASTASNYAVLSAYQLQRNLRTDLMGKTLFSEEKLKNNFESVKKQWTNYPQLSYVGTVNNVFLANYAIKAKQYDEALKILDKSKSYNVDALLVKAFKAEIFLNAKENLDSARYYSEQVFDIYPAFKTNYYMLKKIYATQKDTASLIKAMHRYSKHNFRDIAEWQTKANTIYEFTKDSDLMLKVLDTALAYNTYSQKLLDAKKEIKEKVGFKSYLSKAEVKAKHQEAYNFFVKQQYEKARAVYLEILKTNPKDFLSIQNIGIIDLIQKNYEAAIKNLSRVIKARAFTDGKAEYSRGYCYEQLGKLEKSKEDYRASRAKNYPQAISLPPSKYEE